MRYKSNRNIRDIISVRFIILMIIVVLSFVMVMIKLFSLSVLNKDKYDNLLVVNTEKIITSNSTPRGRIYDRNYNLLVDNVAVKTIYYKKEKKVTVSEEIALAYKLAYKLDIDYSKLTDKQIKEFFLINNDDFIKLRISDEVYDDYEKRRINNDDLYDIKLGLVTDLDIRTYNDIDKEAIYIYYLMNKGYSYQEKIIKNKNVTEEEYAYVSENNANLRGINTKLDWERLYLYGDTFKSILGKVSSESQGIPLELKDYYLDKGYSLNDRVGISYLEYQYEDYLKGTKAKYKLLSDNTYELVSDGSRGNDIVLTIDINVQMELEKILSEEVLKTKSEANTEYYNRSFVVIEDPKTGEILAMSGKQVLKDDNGSYYVQDYTPGVVTLPVTPGSIVKGASISVGYKYGVLNIGDYYTDTCLKIKDTKEKCSWTTLGYINDLTALEYSSNIYQFLVAIKVANGNYQYDQALPIDVSAFDKYREMYAEYGLGVKTGIDLPLESIGYKGTSQLPGHLLDFSIGQYDTYTPIQLSTYMSTVANHGTRVKPYLLKAVFAPTDEENKVFGDEVYHASTEVLGHVSLEDKYLDRIQQGFYQVMQGPLGYGYMGYYQNSAGKTGTSQSFIDTDDDKKVDTETVTSTFGGYAPYDNPKMSIVVISPDVSHENAQTNYTSGVNKRITAKVVNKFFEIFK